MKEKSTEAKSIVIFDDSKDAIKRFRENMENFNVQILPIRNPSINDSILKKIQNFKPQLFIVDLLMGESKIEGYNIIKKINRSKLFENIPIVVCSKFISDTPAGKKEKEECLSFPGVVDALSKFPNYPSGEEILKYIKSL